MTVAEHAAFLRAICESPHDVGPRQMYADWLMARDDPRGEFVSVQLELWRDFPRDKPKAPGSEERYDRWRYLQQREREFLAGGRDYEWFFRRGVLTGEWKWSFRRGFVESVACRLQDWLDHGPALVLAAPITEVRLVGKEPWHWPDGGRFGWYDLASFHPGDIPSELWNLLDGYLLYAESKYKLYDTAELAHADLGAVAVAWARGKAGLPKLEG